MSSLSWPRAKSLIWCEMKKQFIKKRQTDFIATQCSLMWLNADITKGFGDYNSNNRPESIARNLLFYFRNKRWYKQHKLTQISASRRSVRNSWNSESEKCWWQTAGLMLSHSRISNHISYLLLTLNQIKSTSGYSCSELIGKYNSYNSLVA